MIKYRYFILLLFLQCCFTSCCYRYSLVTNHWNDLKQGNNKLIKARKSKDPTIHLGYIDDGYYYRMSLYWTTVEIDLSQQNNRDFNYDWFTTYDNDPFVRNDSSSRIIQTMYLYFQKDGGVVLRQLIYRKKTSTKDKLTLRDSFIKIDDLLSNSKNVRKDKLKIGVCNFVGTKDGKETYELSLYTPTTSKKIPTDSKVVLIFETSNYNKGIEPVNNQDSLYTRSISSFLKKESIIESNNNNTALKKDELLPSHNSLHNRGQINIIEYEPGLGSNGESPIRLSPDSIFNFGQVNKNTKADLYFRLYKYK